MCVVRCERSACRTACAPQQRRTATISQPHEFAAGVCPKLSYGSTAPEKLPGSAWRSQTERSGLQTRDAHLQMLLGCGALPGGLWGSALYGAAWFVRLFLGVAAGLCRKSASPDLELPRRPGLQTLDAHLQFLLGSEAPGRAPLYGSRGCFRGLLPVSVASCASLRSQIWSSQSTRVSKPGMHTFSFYLVAEPPGRAPNPGCAPSVATHWQVTADRQLPILPLHVSLSLPPNLIGAEPG